jgi:hypothetical protein
MGFELLEREKILISYQGQDVAQAEWDRYIDFMALQKHTLGLRFVVFADGSPPSAANQRRIAEIVRAKSGEWLVALISSSTALRFVVSAFSLVNRSIRFFTPEQLPEALLHIHCTPEEQRAVHEVLQRLRAP